MEGLRKLQIGSNVITSPKRMSEVMNNFFLEKVKDIRKNIPMEKFDYWTFRSFIPRSKQNLLLNFVSLKKVHSLLKKLKSSKSTSVDGLDNFSVKLAADFLVYPLHHIISLSIMQSKFPICQNCACVQKGFGD